MRNNLLFSLMLVGVLVSAAFTSQSMAVEFHVTNATEFQNALSTARDNDADDTIYLAAGIYQDNFTHLSFDGKSLAIRGEPGATVEDVVLDAGDSGTVLRIEGADGGSVSVEGLTVQHGNSSGVHVSSINGSINVILSRLIIQNNNNSYVGGGIDLRSLNNGTVNLTISDSIIRNNQSSDFRGGGIRAHSDNGNSTINLFIVNSLIYKNRAGVTGGGIEVSASELGDNNITHAVIINSTITGNVSNKDNIEGRQNEGGGVRVRAYRGNGTLATLDLYNTIVYGNIAMRREDGQDLHVQRNNPGNATVNALNSSIESLGGDLSLYHPTNVIDSDPLFVDPANDDYHLSADSPCVNAGTSSVPSPPDLPSTDLEGYPRVIGTAPDIGAYEWISVRPDEGTIGTKIIISRSGLGTKKGKVLIGTVALKIFHGQKILS